MSKTFKTENVSTWGGLEPPTFRFMTNALTISVIRARHLLSQIFLTLALAVYKYFYLWPSSSKNTSFCPSVCLSVHLSVTPFSLCSCHRIITKFSGVFANGRSDVHAKGQGHKSKVKVTKVITQLSRFRTVTPVWIHRWLWNDAWSLMHRRRGAVLFSKVNRQISSSDGTKYANFDLNWTFTWL